MDNTKNNKIMYTKETVFLSIISFFIYMIYLEVNPKIGGIWLRKDQNNKFVLTLHSLKDFITYPLKDSRMWWPKMWDVNSFISIPLITGTLYWLKEYINR